MATYRPDPAGTWFAAVRGSVVLMAPASSAAALDALWPELAADDPTSVVLDRLTAGGLASTPSFALVVRGDGGARVVVRGDLTVQAGDSFVSGVGVATWAERLVDASAFEVTSPASSHAGDRELPVVEGVVPAASIRSEGVESVAAVVPSTIAVAAPVVPVVPSVPVGPSVPFEPAVPVAPAEPVVTDVPVVPAVPVAADVPERPTILVPPVPPPAPAAEQTMVPAEDTIAGPVTPAPPLEGDHDGLTVASVDLRRLRAERAARASETSAPGPAVVDGASRPSVVTLRMPDGAIEPLGHEVVLGRAPSVSQVSGARLPRLITIGAGDPDISRSHVRIAVEGGTVVVTDLHSRNGTHVVAPGRPPVKLRAGEPTPVLAGTVVDLGGGWTVQVVAD